MTRSVRSLVVDGVTYGYAIGRVDANHLRVAVWEHDSRRPLGNVRVRFDDPWLHYGELLTASAAGRDVDEVFQLRPLTPATVATIVRALLAATDTRRDFIWRDGALQHQ